MLGCFERNRLVRERAATFMSDFLLRRRHLTKWAEEERHTKTSGRGGSDQLARSCSLSLSTTMSMSESSPPPSSSGSLPEPAPPSSPTPARMSATGSFKVATTPTKAPITSPQPTPSHLARVVLTASNLSGLEVLTPELFHESRFLEVDPHISTPALASDQSSPFIGVGTASPLLPDEHSEVELSSPFLESVASGSGREGSKSPLQNLDTFALSSSPSQAAADWEAANGSQLSSPAPRSNGPRASVPQNDVEDYDLFSENPLLAPPAVVGLGIALPGLVLRHSVPSAVGQVALSTDAVVREGSRTPAPSTPVTDGGVWDPTDGLEVGQLEGEGDDMAAEVQESEGGLEQGMNKEWDTYEEELEIELLCDTASSSMKADTETTTKTAEYLATGIVDGGSVPSSVEQVGQEDAEVSEHGIDDDASARNFSEEMQCGSRLRRRRREQTTGSDASAVSPNPSPVKKQRHGEMAEREGENGAEALDDALQCRWTGYPSFQSFLASGASCTNHRIYFFSFA
uniref:Uncharacterized protein n=1 Tax=Mycena chlorophos TaxID=658473 RepID=A0ABQ0M1J1_MYCCL|nr:predicted protein [Mycena chlorophos]